MSVDIRTVLLGFGLAGRAIHTPLVKATPGIALRAVVTNDPRRREQVVNEVPGATIFAEVDEVWEAADNFDLAIIATANANHADQAIRALSLGLHVVVEKPLAGTAREALAIAAAAVDAGRQVHPFQNRRWDSDFLTLKRELAIGSIGRVHRLESRMESFRVPAEQLWRDSPIAEDLRGVLFELGSHLVDQAIELLGPVCRVTAHIRSLRRPVAADDDVELTLTHSNGSISILIASKVAAIGGPRFLALGSDGGIRIDAVDSQERALRSGVVPVIGQWGVEPSSSHALLRRVNERADYSGRAVPFMNGGWDRFYPAVRDAIRDGSKGPVPLGDAIENVRVLEAARASSANGRTIELSPAAGHLD